MRKNWYSLLESTTELPSGFEPPTSALPRRRSTNWAKAAWMSHRKEFYQRRGKLSTVFCKKWKKGGYSSGSNIPRGVFDILYKNPETYSRQTAVYSNLCASRSVLLITNRRWVNNNKRRASIRRYWHMKKKSLMKRFIFYSFILR